MKKSQQSKNKCVVLNLSKNNTKTKVGSLGEVELKYVSYGNKRDFANFLRQKISDKDFVLKILFHQLIKPKIKFDQFQKLSDKEIEKIGKVFVKKENYTFKYFQDTGDFFKDFRQAIQTQNEKHIEEFRKSFEPIIKSAQNALTAFQKNYGSVIQQTVDVSSYIQDTMRQFTSIAKQFQNAQLQMVKSIKPIIEQYNATACILAETIKPQIEVWQKWVEQNKHVFENIGKQWPEFQERYNITEKKAVMVLQKYNWFISPSTPIDFIFEVVQLGQEKGRQYKTINKLFIDYFSQNNWQNLEAITRDWDKNPLLKKRNKIVNDCVKTLKNSDSKTNAVNVVLPTLIAQIDGFLTDYLDSKGIPYDCAYDDYFKKGKDRKVGRKSQFRKNSSKVLTSNLDDLAKDIFLNILFQGSQKGKSLKRPINFYRHKIMHGENTNYGRKDYLIRSFLLLDFFAHLK